MASLCCQPPRPLVWSRGVQPRLGSRGGGASSRPAPPWPMATTDVPTVWHETESVSEAPRAAAGRVLGGSGAAAAAAA